MSRGATLANRLLRWETLLALVLVVEFVLFAQVSPYFLDVNTLSDATFNFTERAIVALPLALLIIAGEIDISVAAIIALSSVAMGIAASTGAGTGTVVCAGLGTGLGAGMINGALVTLGRVPSIVATIGTMTLFRGAAYAVLGDRVLKDYPSGFEEFTATQPAFERGLHIILFIFQPAEPFGLPFTCQIWLCGFGQLQIIIGMEALHFFQFVTSN
jgi:rhamnose transport system permease protein